MKQSSIKSYQLDLRWYVLSALIISAMIMIGGAILGAPHAMSNSPQTADKSAVCKSSYSLISYELRPRSVPKFVQELTGELAVSPEQKRALKALMQRVPVEVLPMRDHIQQLEIKLLQALIDQGKTPQALKSELDEIQLFKRELAEKEMVVFNELRSILNPAQYKQAMLDAGWLYALEE